MKKVIVITGASSGIGAALAKALGREGCSLVLAARREDELHAVAREASPSAVAVVTDVTKRSEVLALRDRALAAFGHIDVWVNNAGRGIARPVLELTDEDIDDMVLVNLKSALYGMQAVVPHFQERNAGQIVNVSSFLARVPLASVRSAYSASKAALNSLTANLRMDLAVTHPGIHVTVVMPGMVRTTFAATAAGSASTGGAAPAPTGPLPPSQSAEEVAAAIVSVIAEPVPELFTNPVQKPIAAAYAADVAAFEQRMRG